LRSDPVGKRRGKEYPIETVRAYIDALNGEARAECIIAAQLGLRFTEIKRFSPSWVCGDIVRVPAWASKTRRERVAGAVSSELRAILKAHTKGPDDPIISNADHSTARFASHGARITGDVQAVQASLGHSDLKTTQKYLHASEARAVAVSKAVTAALGKGKKQRRSRHTKPVTPDGKCVKWRAVGDSNARPSASESVSEILEHVNACIYCQDVVRNCAKTLRLVV
jgi:hypothetical protein